MKLSFRGLASLELGWKSMRTFDVTFESADIEIVSFCFINGHDAREKNSPKILLQ